MLLLLRVVYKKWGERLTALIVLRPFVLGAWDAASARSKSNLSKCRLAVFSPNAALGRYARQKIQKPELDLRRAILKPGFGNRHSYPVRKPCAEIGKPRTANSGTEWSQFRAAGRAPAVCDLTRLCYSRYAGPQSRRALKRGRRSKPGIRSPVPKTKLRNEEGKAKTKIVPNMKP